ncbi:hypothetical protein SLA2020_085500 [Shorea laevis]
MWSAGPSTHTKLQSPFHSYIKKKKRKAASSTRVCLAPVVPLSTPVASALIFTLQQEQPPPSRMAQEDNPFPFEETSAFLDEFEQLFNEAKATATVRVEIIARLRKIKVFTITYLVFRLMVICMFGV